MLTKYKNMITTSIRTSMGQADGFRPLGLDPPEHWEENNQQQLHIISPMSYTEETNGFKIISPISDISNPSDVWRMNQPVVVQHQTHYNPPRNSNNNQENFFATRQEFMDKENIRSDNSSRKAKGKKGHHRIDSLTRVFGCFDENIKMNTIKKQQLQERRAQRQLVEI